MRSSTPRRWAAWLAAACALLLACGCATVQNPHPDDPWEPMNRTISDFNEGLDTMVLKPAATVYRNAVPPLVRTGVSNFFGNLSDVWSFVNSALQFKLQAAADNFARVQINTLFGLFGIFDVASDLQIDRHPEDFGRTLGHWGIGTGPYLVLPFFGPSTLRDTVALPVDRKLDPLRKVRERDTRHAAYALRAVDRRANLLRVSSVLEEVALDKYSFTRDAFLQRRRLQQDDQDDGEDDEPPQAPAAQ